MRKDYKTTRNHKQNEFFQEKKKKKDYKYENGKIIVRFITDDIYKRLSEWDRIFIKGISNQDYPLTTRQLIKLKLTAADYK